jgi:hypothetical protein
MEAAASFVSRPAGPPLTDDEHACTAAYVLPVTIPDKG